MGSGGASSPRGSEPELPAAAQPVRGGEFFSLCYLESVGKPRLTRALRPACSSLEACLVRGVKRWFVFRVQIVLTVVAEVPLNSL